MSIESIDKNNTQAQKPRQHLNFLIAVLVILLLIGILVLLFFAMKNNHQTTAANQTKFPSSIPSKLMLSDCNLMAGTEGTNETHGTVCMVTEQVGWSLELDIRHNGQYAGPGPLLHTINGGKNWQQVPLPHGILPIEINTVQIFDGQMALIETSADYYHFYRTVDTGASWQSFAWPTTMPASQEQYTPIPDYTFLDHSHGWVNMIETPVGASEKQTLFRTDDGGKSWHFVSLLPFKYRGSPTFTNLQIGWFVTYGYNVNSAVGCALYITHDGGHTWKQQPLPALPHVYNLSPLTFLTPDEGYLFATIQNSVGTSTVSEYSTQDGGNSWHKTPVTFKNATNWQIVDSTHVQVYERDLSQKTPTPGKSGSVPLQTFLLTLVHGQWIQTANNFSLGALGSAQFVSSQTALALMPSNNGVDVYKTSDGGNHWSIISTLPKA